MVDLSKIHTSNTHLPARLTGVFVGATSGIGLYTILAFARHCTHPTAYFIGRSQPAATRILADLKRTNPNGAYHFIKSDVALIKNVDDVCAQIRDKEKHINILVLSQGTLITGQETEEGLHVAASLIAHSRTRFTLNLLPLLRAAPDLRRIVSVFTGTKEGPITATDIQMRDVKNPIKVRGQGASLVTLLMEKVQKQAPEVSFVHSFPGPVKSNIARGGGVANMVMRAMYGVFGRWIYIPEEESGERHLFLATNVRYPARQREANGTSEEEGMEVAKGTDGVKGSGVYTVDEKCESGGVQVVQVLKQSREQGKEEFVWKQIREEYIRITGKESL